MGVLSVHLCDAGNPVRQVVLPSICLVLILTTIERPMAKWLAAMVAVLGAVLTYHAVELVHDGYPTNPRYAERQRRIVLMRIASEMRGRAEPGASTKPVTTGPTHAVGPRAIPADLLLAALGEQHLTAAGEVLVPVSRRRWFTNLTGMYQVEKEPMRVMFRGTVRRRIRSMDLSLRRPPNPHRCLPVRPAQSGFPARIPAVRGLRNSAGPCGARG